MKIPFLLLFLAIVVHMHAIDKLDEIVKGGKVTSTFGDYRLDHFHTGLDIAAKDSDIHSPADSEVIFYNSDRYNSIKYGNGNFAVVEDLTGAIRISYSHLKDGSFNEEVVLYKKGDVIGKTGNSGHSTGSHLHLEIEDVKSGRLINPLKYLDVTDDIKPEIKDVYFITDGNELISLKERGVSKIKRGGKLFVRSSDRINNSNYLLTPYKITVYVDGQEKQNLTFDYLLKKSNAFVAGEDKKYSDVYTSNSFYNYHIMDYYSLPGLLGLKVVVEDIKGNKTVFTKPVKILLP